MEGRKERWCCHQFLKGTERDSLYFYDTSARELTTTSDLSKKQQQQEKYLGIQCTPVLAFDRTNPLFLIISSQLDLLAQANTEQAHSTIKLCSRTHYCRTVSTRFTSFTLALGEGKAGQQFWRRWGDSASLYKCCSGWNGLGFNYSFIFVETWTDHSDIQCQTVTNPRLFSLLLLLLKQSPECAEEVVLLSRELFQEDEVHLLATVHREKTS